MSAAGATKAPPSSGSGTVITSSSRVSKIRFSDAGIIAVTYPAPARIADSEDMHGAPVSPSDPPQTSTLPAANFVDSVPRLGISPVTRSSINPIRGSPGAPGGMPMSTTRTSPAWALPGAIHRPGLAAWNVPVARARAAPPATSPVDASTPLGTSQATTTAPRPLASLIAAIALAAGSRGAPAKPVPRIASTIAAAPSSDPASNCRGGAPGRRAQLLAASPLSSSGDPSRMTSTS